MKNSKIIYGGTKFKLFLNKFLKNKLKINGMLNELDIISIVMKKDEKMEKIKNKEKKILEENNNKNYKKINHKQNNSEYNLHLFQKPQLK